MNFHFQRKAAYFLLGLAMLTSMESCIDQNYELGANLIPADEMYDIYRVDIPLSDIKLQYLDSLTGYSNDRIVIGALRDKEYGLTTRSSAITLIPLLDTMDFGKNPQFRRFHFAIKMDTLSVAKENEKSILQNIYVHELSHPIDTLKYDVLASIDHEAETISDGIPVYSGNDSLSFNFSKAFGEKYMGIRQEDLKNIKTYLKKFPGIYLESEKPVGAEGGRINLFRLQLDYDFSRYYLKGNYARLSFNSEYKGVRKDTSFFFYYSALDLYKMDSLIKKMGSSSSFPQYCQNIATHETQALAGKAKEKIHVEGGAGIMPSIPAYQIRDALLKDIAKNGGTEKDIQNAIVNKASIIMPFEFPADYKELDNYPRYISPCTRTTTKKKTVVYSNLTNSSSQSEDPGKINRSVGKYAPDITFHVQQMLTKASEKDISSYDIYFTTLATEVKESKSSSSSNRDQDYYRSLAYSNYYNNMMYGGYGGYGMGGYGGYGGYGYGDYYSNYYSYMMAARMYSGQSRTTKKESVSLDKDRFYKATLCGPESKEHRPFVRIIYALPKKQ